MECCQTWRRSPLKRDDCAVSGWMTMAPCARGSDRLDCRRRCGRLQSPELVLCDCSSGSERGLLGSRHCTQPSAPITELVPSAKMSNGAAVAQSHYHWFWPGSDFQCGHKTMSRNTSSLPLHLEAITLVSKLSYRLLLSSIFDFPQWYRGENLNWTQQSGWSGQVVPCSSFLIFSLNGVTRY